MHRTSTLAGILKPHRLITRGSWHDGMQKGPDSLAPTGVRWQWKHKTGFRDYAEKQSARIEHAYKRGEPKVRLKSGKAGHTPMEIFFVDMVQYDPISANVREVQRVGPNNCFHRLSRLVMEAYCAWYTGKPYRETYKQYQQRRDKIIHGEDEPNVRCDTFDLYHESSCCATVAKSSGFFACTMAIIVLNALWLSIDLDNNSMPVWTQASWEFQVGENAFCTYFTIEILVRFCAFREKKDCLSDRWFRFDLALVFLMVGETWLLPIIVLMVGNSSAGRVDFNNLSVLRLARLIRLTRMTRLIRAVPEVMTLMKGIIRAFRSVMYTILLLVLMLYVFGIVFRSWSMGTVLEHPYFASVPRSMWTLVMHGTFLDSVSVVMEDIAAYSPTLTFLFFFFILLSSFTVVNMLIGIVCEVITLVKREEEEVAERSYLATNLLDILVCYDKDDDRSIGSNEFELMLNNPEALDTIERFGTDADGLVGLVNVYFESEGRNKLSFDDLFSVIMRLQGQHAAKVTDVVELRKFMSQSLSQIRTEMRRGFERLDEPSVLRSVQPAPAVTPRLVDVQVTFDGRTRMQRHAASFTVEQLLQQLGPDTDSGRLVATDAAGVEVGPELTLGDLALSSGAFLELFLIRP